MKKKEKLSKEEAVEMTKRNLKHSCNSIAELRAMSVKCDVCSEEEFDEMLKCELDNAWEKYKDMTPKDILIKHTAGMLVGISKEELDL